MITNSEEDDDNTGEDARKALVEFIRSAPANRASFLADTFNDFMTIVGREASRQRRQYYIEPFQCELSNIESFDKVIMRVLSESKIHEKLLFECHIGLKNRRVISCHSITELDRPGEADKSYPTDIEMSWTYHYPVEWKGMQFLLPYKISIDFSVDPRKDIKGSMAFAVAPEQYTEMNIKGPVGIIRSLNEELDAVIRTTWLPFWWRYPKKILQLFEPYIGLALYVAAGSTVLFTLQHIDEIFGGKSKDELRAEILASRQETLKERAEFNKKVEDVANEIKKSPSIEAKFDIYTAYMLEPSKPPEFKPIEEVLADPGISLPVFMVLLFGGFIVAGILHILFMELYKRLTPPSIIVIGQLGRERLRFVRIYDVIASILIATIIGAIITAIIATMSTIIWP